MRNINKITIMGLENEYEFILPNELELPEDLHIDEANDLFIILSILGLKYTKKKIKRCYYE